MNAKRKNDTLKVHSHCAFACAYVFALNFNIVSMMMLTLTQRMNIEPIHCIVLLPLLLLFSRT